MKALKNILGATAVAVAFSSCLKDKKIDDQEYGMINYTSNKIVELAAPPTHVLSFALKFENRDTILKFATVNIAADQPVTEDVTVELSLANSNTMIADYNTANGAAIVPFPANLYTVQGSGLTVTIPKGSRFGYFEIKLNPSTFNPSSTYGLGFTISSVNKQGYTISSTFNKVLVLIGAKNKYDGRYTVNGTCVDANGLYHGEYPTFVDLITVSANTVIYYNYDWDYPNYIVISNSTGGAANTGIRPQITFNTTTNAVTGAINANNAAVLTVGPGSFDEANRSLHLEWILGRWNVKEDYTFLSERD